MNLLVICLLGAFSAASASAVPAFLWSWSGENGHRSFESVAVPLAGHSVSSSEFLEGYIDLVSSDANIAVFLHDVLSADDITTYANVYNDPQKQNAFKSLQTIMEGYDSMYLPKVKTAADAIKSLEEHFIGNIQHFDIDYDDNLTRIELDPRKRNLFIFDLRERADDNHELSLEKTDELMGRITKQLAGQGKKFLAIFTGRESSKERSSQLHYGRHLLAEPDQKSNETLYNVNNCFFLYATQVGVLGNDGQADFLPPVTIETKVENCQNATNISTTFSYSADDLQKSNFSKFDLNMNVSIHKDGYWYIDHWDVVYSNKQDNAEKTGTLEANNRTLFGVADRSYYCGNETVKFKVNASKGAEQPAYKGIIMTGVQMQFHIKNGTFDTKYFVNTCEGFFSITAISSLLVLLLFTLIIMFGVCMLMTLKTMDRFDDPRGKPLQINASE